MNKKEWQSIDRARELLKLDDRATLGEMKRAYHRMCKKYHPDRAGDSDKGSDIMYHLTEAYELLMRYTDEYRFPLTPGDGDIY
ncbi:MAG: J domain-containing protein, partial [Thermodesulfobacteriota bacterium]|nr:J domain-containing protein [Thermodesulfobacteriota bacterium]